MNEKLYHDTLENAIRISEFDSYLGETSFSNIAAKFVVQGSETYIVKGKKYVVKEGEYLLGNNNQTTEVQIDNKAKGFCLDVSVSIIEEIIEATYNNPDLKEFLTTDSFLINKYHSENTTLGYTLHQLIKTLNQAPKELVLSAELFYSIGENIVYDQSQIFAQRAKLHFKKQDITDDVFRKLLLAKDYIESCFLEPIQLEKLCQIATMSKYAFIRLFKTSFGVTPYQLILQKRLQKAKALLLSGELIQDVALNTGFADVPSFSKAFKNYFGVSPSAFRIATTKKLV